jgi:hypothetical protein
MRVFTESDVENGDNDYPYAGNNSIEAVAWYAHPLYETEDPFYMHDVGVVILEEPGVVGLDEYGVLPELDEFDDLPMPSGKSDKTWFTSVGYGRQAIFSDEDKWEFESVKIRMVANNHSTGGTCFGDSGGPNFLGDSNLVAGVTSFGMNKNCAGTGGVFRTDRQDVLDFVLPFLEE